ncbi:NUDIX hydrolase [Floricoccus penangensis]|uniref:NUDIX hydrolase n=1 Tax=Floricoccus penangensis TaxID=1859475 RepID=A0A9Q5JFC3_9LACT|nr:NUDIX hydrolase [Floricoccus penangensis]OFI45800.1 NUDIX hydrolase [Floricoccus penangensis]
MLDKFNDTIGIYGVVHSDDGILVIKKNAGPYINRFDLPGGCQQSGESMADTLIRKVEDETSIIALEFEQIGATNFIFPWDYKDTNMNNHLAIFYNVNEFKGEAQPFIISFDGQDSSGALWLPLEFINPDNASLPLLKAKDFIENGKFNSKSWRLKQWDIPESPVYKILETHAI